MSRPASPVAVAGQENGAGSTRKISDLKANGQSKKAAVGTAAMAPHAERDQESPPPPPTPTAQQHLSTVLSSHSQDGDLFNFLSAMHLSGGANMNLNTLSAIVSSSSSSNVIASRKRKLLEQAGSSSGKLSGGLRPFFMRRGSDEDEEHHSLQTPQCSQSGYADEEDHHNTVAETAAAAAAAAMAAAAAAAAAAAGIGASSLQITRIRQGEMLSPVDIAEDENLAASFDDSLSGLGVDITTTNYSMSEALLALPNLSISSSQMFKQEGGEVSGSGSSGRGGGGQSHHHPLQHSDSPPTHMDNPRSFKDEANSRSNSSGQQMNYGALDLSNDEAHLPDNVGHHNSDEDAPKTFIGSVSRESSRGGTPGQASGNKADGESNERANGYGASSKAGKRDSANRRSSSSSRTHKVILPLQNMPPPATTTSTNASATATNSAAAKAASGAAPGKPVQVAKEERLERLNQTTAVDDGNKFQYILVASTSIATKKEEATITYLNQGQSYELRLKKLGDLSGSRERRLKCVMRICFHERRLQYMEAEQIAEWKNAHPGERIIDFDLPLSYGISDPEQDPKHLNAISFKWDPTRDTGIFIKVQCISTEFTPKKHGGEKGVPFRLQVETFDPSEGARLHAAGCVLQVFKLKGADRKHKQDRDKIAKRPPSEQEKFAPSYDCTVLTDLNIDNIYVPPSRSVTPQKDSPGTDAFIVGGDGGGGDSVVDEAAGLVLSRGSSPQRQNKSITPIAISPVTTPVVFEGGGGGAEDAGGSSLGLGMITMSTSPETVVQWLGANRYGNHVACFGNYNGRDMLRLMRDEIVTLCGLADGIRLFNEIHMVAVAPRNTFYVAHKNQREYSALFLEEPTVSELLLRLAVSFGLEPCLFSRAFIVGPHGILIRVTDDVIAFTKPETIFQFSLRSDDSGDCCDVILDNVTPLLEAADAEVTEDIDSQQQQQLDHHQMPPPHTSGGIQQTDN
jgi:transcription factor CP2-like protein